MADDDWVEILELLGAPVATAPVPEGHAERYSHLPPLLRRLWREVGFAGFYDGRVWLCDPAEWAPAVDAWTAGLDLPFGPDRWHAICRSAFGSMWLWGDRTGQSLSIEPVHGLVSPHSSSATSMDTDFLRDVQVEAVLVGPSAAKADLWGDDEEPLFARARAAHGPLGPDTMYTFVPALSAGGSLTVDRIVVDDAATHVALLADLGPRVLLPDLTAT